MRKRNIWKRIFVAMVMLSLMISNTSPAFYMGTAYAAQEMPNADTPENGDNTSAPAGSNQNTPDTPDSTDAQDNQATENTPVQDGVVDNQNQGGESTKEQPEGGEGTEEQPTDGENADALQPTDGEDAGKQPTDGEDTGKQPTDGEDAGTQPTGGEDAGKQPTDGEGTDTQPTDGEDAGRQPTDGEGTDTQPIDGEDTDTQPTGSENTGAQQPADAETVAQPEGSLEDREKLANASMDEAEAAMWPGLDVAAPFSMEGNVRTMVDAQASQWEFNIYYVNEDDFRNVTKTENFSLKYQMEFRALSDIHEKEIQIKIERSLFSDRNGNPVNPADIGVPRAEGTDLETAFANRKDSRSTSFNYYIETVTEGETTVDYLVFFNYKNIAMGTNAAWQVLYRNVKLMSIKDLTTGKLQAALYINETLTDVRPEPLSITVDSYVELNRVVKTVYQNKELSYTPELYTEEQVKEYVDLVNGKLPTGYLQIRDDETGEIEEKDFNDYVYMVWEVNASGKGNQPFHLYIKEAPYIQKTDADGRVTEIPGKVVGFKNKSTQYPVTFGDARWQYEMTEWGYFDWGEWKWYPVTSQKTDLESWELDFYVVTAYLKEDMKGIKWDDELEADVEVPMAYDILGNDITVMVAGADQDTPIIGSGDAYPDFYPEGDAINPLRETQQKTSRQTFQYQEYEWQYEGDLLEIKKSAGNDLPGWLKLYEIAGEADKGYGGLSFKTESRMYGYDLTHRKTTDGVRTGEYIQGTAYELTTVDDLLYVYLEKPTELPGIEPHYLLEKDDYYYSKVTVKQTDWERDIWQDSDVVLQENRDIDRNVYIWAMFAKGSPADEAQVEGTEAGTWELVKVVPWSEGSSAVTYSFSADQIEREPYRVKVVHKATGHRTICNIEKEIFIKPNSKISEIISAYNASVKEPDVENQELIVRLEELSGNWGTSYEKDPNGSYRETGKYYNTDGDQDSAVRGKNGLDYNKYLPGEMGAASDQIYGALRPFRAVTARKVSGMVEKAEAFKRSKSTNDPENQRILVDYSLTAYDGYKIYDTEAINYLKSTAKGREMSPGRSQVVFYDLLPYGMQFDRSSEVTAGRITDLGNESYKTTPQVWNTNQVTVNAKDIVITRNWRNTGRTMVEFHLTYSGADAAEYSNGMWAEGWGVSFRAYYDWSNQDVIREEANLCAFMPERGDTKPLCGTSNQVFCDNGELPDGMEETYQDLLSIEKGNEKGGIDGEEANYAIPQVLYAKDIAASDGYAGSGETKITKRIYAQENQSLPEESATIVPGDIYLYEIAVEVSSGAMKDIVVFDRLENAAEDFDGKLFDTEIFQDSESGSEKNYNFSGENRRWSGTFQSVVTTGLEKMGIQPEVYYWIGDLEKNAAAGLEKDAEKAIQYLAEKSENFNGSGWVHRDTYEADTTEYDAEEVKAIAVVLKGRDGDSYILNGNTDSTNSVTFQVKMKAPSVDKLRESVEAAGGTFEEQKISEYYAYNNPYYFGSYQQATSTDWNFTSGVGAPAKANLAQSGSLEVVKAFNGKVPDSVKNTSFRFRLYWEDTDAQNNTIKRGAGGKEYTIEKKTITADGSIQWVPQDNRLYETDASGYFSLRADEKAVFDKNIPNVEQIKLEEKASLFWEEDGTSDLKAIPGKENSYRFTVSNRFRTVLFVEKKLGGVPESALADVKDHVFRFQVQVKRKGDTEWQTLKSAPFSYMDRASANGKAVGEMQALTPAGTFDMKADQAVALFLDNDVVEYRVQELGVQENQEDGFLSFIEEKNDSRLSWICGEPGNTKIGPVKIGENKATVTNYYRYKDLELVKRLENQEDKEKCEEIFVFELYEVVKNEHGTEGETLVTEAYEWELLDMKGNPVLDDTKKPVTGLVENGSFRCACGGRKVRIKGLPLAAGETETTYVVREIPQEGSKYEPVNATAEATLHRMNDRATLTIVNNYLYYDLSVNKIVLPPVEEENNGGETDYSDYADLKFTMQVNIEGEPLRQKEYSLMSREGRELKPTEEEYDAETEELRQKAIADGKNTEADQNAFIAEHRNIKKVTADNTSTFSYQTNAEGEFWLKDGQSALWDDVGKQGQKYGVREMQDAKYPQVLAEGDRMPATGEFGPYTEGTFTYGQEAAVGILNGGGDYLMLRKEFVGVNEGGREVLQWLRRIKQKGADGEVREDYWKEITTWNKSDVGRDWSVPIYLKVKDKNGEICDWPNEETRVWRFDGQNIREDLWTDNGGYYSDNSFMLGLDEAVLIRKSDLEGFDSYQLTEKEAYQDLVGIFNYATAMTGEQYCQRIHVKQRDGETAFKSLAENPVAVIHNEVEGFLLNGSIVGKAMIPGSEAIPEGAKLVWRLEQYQEGQWVPASGVQYMTGDYVEEQDAGILSGIAESDSEGRIILEKKKAIAYENMGGELIPGDPLPVIVFLDAKVYVNLQEGDTRIEDGVYRLAEAPEDEEYHSSWGRLVGYSEERGEGLTSKPEPRIFDELLRVSEAMKEHLGVGVSFSFSYFQPGYGEKDALGQPNCFYNSNRNGYLDVEKQMDMASGESFTMILQQVVSAQKDASGKIVPTAVILADKIPYRLYYSDGTSVDKEVHVTEADGTFLLQPGQYARLELPDDTYWTVEEKTVSGYKTPVLKSGMGAGESVSVSDNGKQMYIHAMAENLVLGEVRSYLLPEHGVGAFTEKEAQELSKEDFYIGAPMSDGSIRIVPADEYELKAICADGSGPEMDFDTWKNGEATCGVSYSLKLVWKNGKTAPIDLGKIQKSCEQHGSVQDGSVTVLKLNSDNMKNLTFGLNGREEKAVSVFPEGDGPIRVFIYNALPNTDGQLKTVINGIEAGTFSGDLYKGRDVEVNILGDQMYFVYPLPYIDEAAFEGCRSVKIYVTRYDDSSEYYRLRYKNWNWNVEGSVEFLEKDVPYGMVPELERLKENALETNE